MIGALVEIIISIILSVNYMGIFILMALESTLVPIPSELIMPFAGFLVASGQMVYWKVILAGTLGCLAGSLFSYWLGWYGGEKLVRRFGKYLLLNIDHLKMAEKWFEKHGSIMVFLGRFVPGIRHVISIPAGIGKMDLAKFSIFTFLGAAIWNIFLVYLGIVLQQNWKVIYDYTGILDIIIVVIVFFLLVYYIVKILESVRMNKLKDKKAK